MPSLGQGRLREIADVRALVKSTSGGPYKRPIFYLRGQVQDGSDCNLLSHLSQVLCVHLHRPWGVIPLVDLSGSPTNYHLLC